MLLLILIALKSTGADGTLPFWEALRTLQDQAGRKRRGTGCPRYVSYSGLYICQYNGCRIRTKPSLIVFLLSSVGEFATDVNRKTPVGIRVRWSPRLLAWGGFLDTTFKVKVAVKKLDFLLLLKRTWIFFFLAKAYVWQYEATEELVQQRVIV